MKLNDRNYLRTLPTLALLDAAKHDSELSLVLAERLTEAQVGIAKLWRQWDAMRAVDADDD